MPWTGRGGFAALFATIAVATVAVPPLIAPHPHATPPAAPSAPSAPSTPSTPSPPSPPAEAGAEAGAAPAVRSAAALPRRTPRPAPPRPTPARPSRIAGATPAPHPAASCSEPRGSGSDVTLDATHPSCEVYAATLGTGWAVSAAGTKVLPGERIPGSSETAVRVETLQEPASVTFMAASSVGTAGHGHLRLRLYGGRFGGTVVRLSLSAADVPDPSRAVVLRSPADRWTTYTVATAGLLPGRAAVRRIDIAVATDLMPRAGRFFLDDIAFVA